MRTTDLASEVPMDRVNPLHGARDAAKLAALAAAMRANGWQGRPLLGELCADGYTVRLWTGSHRYAAALAIGIDEVPVYLLDVGALGADYERSNSDLLGECYRDSMPEDDGEILRILRGYDTVAAELFELDA